MVTAGTLSTIRYSLTSLEQWAAFVNKVYCVRWLLFESLLIIACYHFAASLPRDREKRLRD